MATRTRPPVYTVSAVNHHISSLFSEDPVLAHIYVRGELSNVKYASSGHLYFSLKDEKSQLRCAMWASSVRNLKTPLKDGDSVIAYGQISVFERDGTYQLYVTAVRMESGGVADSLNSPSIVGWMQSFAGSGRWFRIVSFASTSIRRQAWPSRSTRG